MRARRRTVREGQSDFLTRYEVQRRALQQTTWVWSVKFTDVEQLSSENVSISESSFSVARR